MTMSCRCRWRSCAVRRYQTFTEPGATETSTLVRGQTRKTDKSAVGVGGWDTSMDCAIIDDRRWRSWWFLCSRCTFVVWRRWLRKLIFLRDKIDFTALIESCGIWFNFLKLLIDRYTWFEFILLILRTCIIFFQKNYWWKNLNYIFD